MRRPRPLKLSALVFCVAAAATACSGIKPTVAVSGDPKSPASPASIAKFLEEDKQGRFKTLLACVDYAGASAAVTGTGPVTLFAPTNEAFSKAGVSCEKGADGAVDKTKAAAVLRTLQQHIVAYDVRFAPAEGYDPKNPPRLLELVTSGSVTLDSELTDAPGTALVIASSKTVHTQASSTPTAKVIEADVQAPNGMVQVIDTVLPVPTKAKFPPTTAAPKPFE